MISKTELEIQKQLKEELQSDTSSSKLEKLAAALFGKLLNIPVAVAKSGFQHGGDAGPAGYKGRRFRIECKKYGDATSLSDREILGEVDHALARDDALEAWILVATRNVPEQLAQDLNLKGERLGVPIVIVDWDDANLAPLAALCTLDPSLVEAIFSERAGSLVESLKAPARQNVEALKRNLQSWCLGFSSLRSASHAKLDAIWTWPRTSNAEMGQNAAGGAHSKKVRRRSVHDSLSRWWENEAKKDAPAAVIGWDGVGKTWAALDWLVDRKAEQPIVLVVPSSAAAAIFTFSETSLKRFIADRLYQITSVRDPNHWLRRLDYLLKRPAEEGPVLTVFFDGLNQESAVRWPDLFKVLQGTAFEGKMRVIATTRKHHFEEKLSSLKGLVIPAIRIEVGIYDTEPGGELDQMLGYEGLSRDELHEDLVQLARTPRLFNLVVRFRERLVEAGQVTVHRLLWEYGRDTFGQRSGRSFSEQEWRAWLSEIAKRYRAGLGSFSVKSLAETAERADLSADDVYARLSDIIDGQFAKVDSVGTPTFLRRWLRMPWEQRFSHIWPLWSRPDARVQRPKLRTG